MHSFFEDVRLGLRNLVRRPAFTAVAVLALALGIGPNTAIFTVVNGVLLQPLPFRDSSRLYTLQNGLRNQPLSSRFGAMSDFQITQYQKESRSFEQVAAESYRPMGMNAGGEAVAVRAFEITTNFWQAMGAQPIVGRTFLPEEGVSGREQTVLLSEQLWRSRFHSDSAIAGKPVRLDGKIYVVAGVMPAFARYPVEADLWVPMVLDPKPDGNYYRQVIARARPGIVAQQADAEIETIAARLRGKDENATAHAIPLRDFLVFDVRESLLIFLGSVGLILLIACTNVANLLLVRAQGRKQEMAVRAALGAGRGRLIRQLLTESSLLGLAGGALGLLAAAWGTDLLLALVPAGTIPRAGEIHMDGWVFGFALALSLCTGLVFGLAPALSLSKTNLNHSLQRTGRISSRHGEFERGLLVVAEISLSLILLIAAGLMIKSFVRLRAVDPGFQSGRVLAATVDLPGNRYRSAAQLRAFHEQALEKLAAIPGVTSAAAVNWLPLGGAEIQGDFHLQDPSASMKPFLAVKSAVSPDYFPAMEIRLLAGRRFDAHDAAESGGVVIVNRTFVRLAGLENPLGKRVTTQDRPEPSDWLTIVGVVDDVKQSDLASQAPAAIYRPLSQMSFPFFLSHMTYLVRTTADPHSVAGALRARLREVDPDQPIGHLDTMEDFVRASTASPRFRSQLLGAFSAIALLLAIVGIYGVMAYSVTQRTMEIGIRMALGARPADVLRIVLGRSAYMSLAGILLGLSGALAATRVLKSFLYSVTPTDPATFVGVAALLGAVAVLASAIPAWRATKVDPMVALHYE